MRSAHESCAHADLAPRAPHLAPRTSHLAPRTPHLAPRTSHLAPRDRLSRPRWQSRPLPSQPLLSVLIPVYNEARTLRTIIRRVLASPVGLPMELVCVDDGSRDGSPEILDALAAADPRIRVIRQPRNMGKGAAIITAIQHMRGDIGLIQDADLEYDPADYPGAGRADPRGQGRRGVRLALRLRVAAQDPALLARRREPLPDLAHQHPQRHQPDRHGDLLQGGQGRHPQADAALQQPLRHRAGADDQAGAVEHPPLRSADQLSRAHASPKARRSAGRTRSRRSGRC